MLNLPNIRLIALAVAGAAILAGGLWMRHEWNRGRAAIVEAQALKQTLAQERADRERDRKASEGYQNELETLRNRPVSRQPVRLCINSRLPAANPAAGPRQTAPAAGVVPGSSGSDLGAGKPANEPAIGPDIGPDLRELARRADEVSAQLRAVQSR